MSLGVEGRRGALVAKYNVGVDVGIKVGDAIGGDGILEGSLALARGVIGTGTAGSVGAVAVNVHVVVVAAAALEEDGAVDVATV